MRLAVFTSKYPARIATFFERDMLALLDAGVDLEIFSIYPHDAALWQYALDEQRGDGRLRERTRYLGVGSALRGSAPTLWGATSACARQTGAILPAAARYGPMAVAKSAYVLPKAWAWASERGRDFDHVLAYWGSYAGTCAWAFHSAAGRPIPFSLWLHAGADLYHKPVYLRSKLLYADNIITCCDFNRSYMRKEFAEIYPRIERRISVCHHGLDLSQYPFTREGRAERRIVAVGRLSRYKGFEYLVRAMAILRDRGDRVTLDLVGGGELRRHLEALVGELGLEGQVSFRGWVEHPEARRAISEATILVHPSDGLGDGLPNVVREAMALGTPVVASAVAGIPEALDDGCGVLVPPRESEPLANAIAALLDDPARRDRIALAARARVDADYDVRVTGRRLAELLTRTVRRGSSRVAPTAVPASV